MAKTSIEPWVKTLTQGRNHLLRLAVLVSVLIPVWFAIAALGTKFGLWDWKVGLGLLTMQIGPVILFAAIFIALASLYAVLTVTPRGGWAMLAVALVIPLAVLGGLGKIRADASGIPPIHDISTNPAAPVGFSAALMQARGEGSNPVMAPAQNSVPFDPSNLTDFSGRSFLELQQEAYPEIKTLELAGRSASDAYTAVKAAVAAQGWTIVTDDPQAGVLEATDTTFWFGFKDDVAIKVTGTVRGATVDARSVSRVGRSDLGANARRLGELLAAIG